MSSPKRSLELEFKYQQKKKSSGLEGRVVKLCKDGQKRFGKQGWFSKFSYAELKLVPSPLRAAKSSPLPDKENGDISANKNCLYKCQYPL